MDSNLISIATTYKIAKQSFEEAEQQKDQGTKYAQQAGVASFLLKVLALDLTQMGVEL
jgi:hypothetical protein